MVTGASSGIGEATARRLAREPNFHVVLVARREDKLNALARELGNATAVAADLTDPEAPGQIRDVVERDHGALHMLVNNAGAAWRGTFADTGWENIERHMKLNFEAPVRLTEALLPLLRTTARSSDEKVCIVNVASTAARVSRPKSGAYSCSKFALAAWSDALAGEELEHGVHVGMVLPGFVKTEGFPAQELAVQAADAVDRLEARGRGRGHPAGWARRQGRALRPPRLLAGRGGSDPHAGDRSARHRGRSADDENRRFRLRLQRLRGSRSAARP